MKLAADLLSGLSIVGLTLAILIHFFVLVLATPLPVSVILTMHLGCFAVGVPTMLVLFGVSDHRSGWAWWSLTPELWQDFKKTGPPSLRRLNFVVFLYFLAILAYGFVTQQGTESSGDSLSKFPMTLFSAGWAGVYGTNLQYLLFVKRRLAEQRYCRRGHKVPPTAGYCRECGSLINEPRSE